MTTVVITWLALALVTVSLGWLTWRAWRARKPAVKWGGAIVCGLLTLILAAVSVVSAIGIYRFYAPRGSTAANLTVAATPEQVARGQHLANSLCVACHTTTGELPLAGGRDILTDSPLPLGNAYSSNLTPSGPLQDWSDGEIMRALQDGLDRDGRPLLVMSSNGVRYLSDEDKHAVIAYLRSQPAVANAIPDPPDRPNLLAAFMFGAGLIELRPPLSGPVAAPPKAATAEYGAYVAKYGDCDACHGPDLNGGASPAAPKGPTLRVVKGWTLDQFVTTLRTGKDPGGHALSDVMPWKYLGRMDDTEIAALYTFLSELPYVQQD